MVVRLSSIGKGSLCRQMDISRHRTDEGRIAPPSFPSQMRHAGRTGASRDTVVPSDFFWRRHGTRKEIPIFWRIKDMINRWRWDWNRRQSPTVKH